MKKEDRLHKDKIEKYIGVFLPICFTNGTYSISGYNKEYLLGCRREGFFAFKVGETIIEKWCGTSLTPPRASASYEYYQNKWGHRTFVEIFLEIEHEEFLATVEVKVSGGDNGDGNWINGCWVSHSDGYPGIKFKITHCDFVGNIDALESEALMARLSYDFS